MDLILEASGAPGRGAQGKADVHDFSNLMSTTARYGHPLPVLRLGTVVAFVNAGKSTEYRLCILPACDSTRLKGEERFPFLPLTRAQTDTEYDLLVPDAEDPSAQVPMKVGKSFVQLEMWSFVVSEATGTVIASTPVGSDGANGIAGERASVAFRGYEFRLSPTGDGGARGTATHEEQAVGAGAETPQPVALPRVVFLKELKADFTQRIVNEFAAQISRVGVTESNITRIKRR